MTTPEARRKTQRSYYDRRREAGERKMSFWLSKDAQDALARLKAEDGSNDTSVEIAILALDMKRQARKKKA
jgi:hypothetical protein